MYIIPLEKVSNFILTVLLLLLKGPVHSEQKKKTFSALAVAHKMVSDFHLFEYFSVILQLHLQRHHCYVAAGATPGAVSACTHHC